MDPTCFFRGNPNCPHVDCDHKFLALRPGYCPCLSYRPGLHQARDKGFAVRSLDFMKEQRRSRRILASVPVEILSSGGPQAALTAVINLHGALILSSVHWPSGSELRIKNPETGLEVRGRVVWSGSADRSGTYKLGIEFKASAPDFWGARYDPHGEEAP